MANLVVSSERHEFLPPRRGYERHTATRQTRAAHKAVSKVPLRGTSSEVTKMLNVWPNFYYMLGSFVLVNVGENKAAPLSIWVLTG